jgi:hypothetical protein
VKENHKNYRLRKEFYPYESIGSKLDYIYTLSQENKFSKFASLMSDSAFYEMLGCCLAPRASVARTQAIELLKLYLSSERSNSFLERTENKTFVLLFLEHLKKYGSEQIRDLLRHTFGDTIKPDIKKYANRVDKKYEAYKVLLQIADISLFSFSNMNNQDLLVVSCFHSQPEIREGALSQLCFRGRDKLENFYDSELSLSALNFSLVLSCSLKSGESVIRYLDSFTQEYLGGRDCTNL